MVYVAGFMGQGGTVRYRREMRKEIRHIIIYVQFFSHGFERYSIKGG